MSTPIDYKTFFEQEETPKYWGSKAAGCIFLAKDTGRLLLAHRSNRVGYEPGTWGTWGGKIDHGETPRQTVAREVQEETGYEGITKIHPLYVYRDGDFEYHNFLVIVPFEFVPQLNWENDNSTWVEYGKWPTPLHFGLELLIKHSGNKIKHVINLLNKKKDAMLKEVSHDERVENFKKWFGNSVVKDSNGKPLVVYHGTNQPLSSFDKKRRGSSTYSSSSKRGFFFTDNSEIAAAYAAKAGQTQRSNVAKYEKETKRLKQRVDRLEKVAQLTGDWEPYEKALEAYEKYELDTMREDDITGQNIIPVFLKIENPSIHDFHGNPVMSDIINAAIDDAIHKGHDGVILKNVIDPSPASTHYIVFNASQIKSAIGNNGEFNPHSSNITKEGMDVPPAIVNSTQDLSPEFINYIKTVENGSKVGFKNGKWFPHKSPEGGLPTIAYGHKLTTNEVERLSNGISNDEAEKLLKQDLSLAKKKVYSDIKTMFGIQVPLDQRQEEMLIDYAFNLGTLKGFPKYTRAVIDKNWKEAAKEYKRTFADTKGERHELDRNKVFFNRYLKETTTTQDVNIKVKSQGLVDEGIYGYTMSSPYSYINYGYEPSRRIFHLFMVQTPKLEDRGQGHASALMNYFFEFIKEKGGALEVGSYTTSGQIYIEPLVQKLAKEYGVRLI